MQPIIKPQDLVRIREKEGLVLVDARTGPNVKEQYQAAHLAGAFFVDLETELAHKKADPAKGGRHPLPNIASFARLLGQLGIHPGSHVVVYDDKNGANAATRFWWMLRSIGHEQVQVLDGGYDAAVAAGMPVSSGEEIPSTYPPYNYTNWKLPTTNLEEVEKAAHDPASLVIDVRDPERYRGEKEPIDSVAGHIPGAVNVPYSSNLDEKGFYLDPGQLHATYSEVIGHRNPQQVIVHCGSGVTACHTLLAFDYAGMAIPKLYVGSWSEWSRNKKPIATAKK